MLACPVLPSLVARSVPLPGPTGRTIAMGFVTPWYWILNTDVSAVNQETVRPERRFPPASRSSAVKYTLSPTARLAVAGCTVTLATGVPGDPTTWIVTASLSPPLEAVTVTVPGCRPMTEAVSVPADDTSAIAGSLLDHVTDGLDMGFPLASPTAAWSTIEPPTPTDVGPVMLRYAPPEPALCSSTESVVVAPVVTATAAVTTEASHGWSARSMRTV